MYGHISSCVRACLLTQHVEVEGLALPVPFSVVTDTGVISRGRPGYSLKDQALVADYNSRADVDVEQLPLQIRKKLLRSIGYNTQVIFR